MASSTHWLCRLRLLADEVPVLQFLTTDDGVITEVGDGNINDVFRVSSAENPDVSVVMKHSPPYVKCLGPDFPLTVHRMKIEYDAMMKFYQILPKTVPKPFYYSEQDNFVLMEDLRGYKDLRKEVIEGRINTSLIKSIAEFASELHRQTNRRSLSNEDFKAMEITFRNDEMVKLTKEFIFTRPWIKTDVTNKSSEAVQDHLDLLYDSPEGEDLKAKVSELLSKFSGKKECLLHGDLHTGSIMVNGKSAKVIDNEFAFVGPTGFDIGLLIANYLFSYYSHKFYPTTEQPDFFKKMQEASTLTIEHYFHKMSKLYTLEELSTLVSEAAGFAGCELVRRIVGAAHVEDLNDRPLAEVACLKLGIELIRRHNTIVSPKEFIAAITIADSETGS